MRTFARSTVLALLVTALLVAGGVTMIAPVDAAPAARPCPASPVHLAGQHVTPAALGGDATCADLRGAVLDGGNFARVSFDRADLTAASLRRTELTAATFRDATLRGAYFDGAHLDQADLSGADATSGHFRGALFNGADVEGATLRRADLSHASLVRADLDGVDLRGADLAWTVSMETLLDGAHLDTIGHGVVQAGLLLPLAMFVLLAIGLLRRTRRAVREHPADLRRAIVRYAYAPVVGVAGVWLLLGAACAAIGRLAAALWFMPAWYGLIPGTPGVAGVQTVCGALVFLAAGVVARVTGPRRPGEERVWLPAPDPAASPFR